LKINEVTIENDSFKKIVFYETNKSIVEDTIDKLIYQHYNDKPYDIIFLGDIGKDFRVLLFIYENSFNDNSFLRSQAKEIDSKIDFGVSDISRQTNFSCICIKCDEQTIIREILQSISYEKFNGGYYAKGGFFGKNADDLIFIGAIGDCRDKRLRAIDLKSRINTKKLLNNTSKICVIKNKSWKKMKTFYSDKELVYDAIKELAYANHEGTLFSMDFFGEIGEDFRIIALIGEENSKDDWQNNEIFLIDKSTLDKKNDFGIHDISKISNVSYICMKFDEQMILKEVLKYVSQDGFGGGYYAKGRFFGKNADDLVFIGVSGDYRDKKLRIIELEKLQY
jgi:hypothetical protein